MNYLNEIVNLMPRVLSLMDRNRFSPAHGCFDRDYWHYKIIRDYPSGIFQQGVLSLALLYKNDFNGNIYYKNSTILEWIAAGLLFWSRIQNRDGSFNEWFPNEHSHVATAFTSYAVSETILLLGDELDSEVRKGLINSLSLSGKWLKNNKDRLVINHTAGAVASLYNIYLLTGDRIFNKAVEEDIDIVLKGQDGEGWFCEYGGADIGYQSLSIDYLAKYFKKSNDSRVRDILDKALNFLVYFIHPDGSSGGIYGGRNTHYLMPHGLVVLASHFSSARYILNSIWPRLDRQLDMFDDRYFIFFMFPNFIQANLEFKEELVEYNGNDFTSFHKAFNNAGLISVKNEKYHFICNLKKGGVFNIFSKDRLVFSNSGYFGISSKGDCFTSQWLDFGMGINPAPSCWVIPNCISKLMHSNTGVYCGVHQLADAYPPIFGQSGRCGININRPFVLVRPMILTPKNLLLLRLFNLTVGRIGRFAQLFNKYIKQKKILDNKKVPIFLKRRVDIKDSEILIEDEIDASRANLRFSRFGLGVDEAVMHVPSSRYFQKEVLDSYTPEVKLQEELNLKGRVKLLQRIVFSGNSPTPVISIEKIA